MLCNIQLLRITLKLYHFIFGNQTPNLIRPISILSEDTASCWILDQGGKSVIFNERKLGKITQFGFGENQTFPSPIGICSISNEKVLITVKNGQILFKLKYQITLIYITKLER